MNILESIKNELSPELVQALSNTNLETVDKSTKAIDGALASLLMAFLKRASTENGLQLFKKLLDEGNFGDQNLPNTIFANDNINKLSDAGNALISRIIPDKKSPLITITSAYSGIKNSSANRVLGVMTVIILNKLKDQAKSNSLDINGLATLFADQKDYIWGNIDPKLQARISQQIGISSMLHLESSIMQSSAILTNKPEKNDKPVSNYTDEIAQESSSFKLKNWIIPIIFALLLAGAGGYFWFTQNQKNSASGVASTDTLVNVIDTTNIDTTKIKADSSALKTKDTLVVEVEEVELPNNQKINIEKGTIPYEIYYFLSDTASMGNSKKMVIKPANFAQELNLTNDAQTIVNDISKIMTAYPASLLKVKVKELTDEVNIENDKKAVRKAFSIKRILMAKNIIANRIDAVGSSTTNKLDYDSAEIELTIKKK